MRISRNKFFAATKRRFVARVLSLVMLVSILPIAQAQDVQVMKVKEKTADAFFTFFDSSGCILTDAFVLLSTHTEKTLPDGSKISIPQVSVAVDVFDICHNIDLRSFFGFTDQFTYEFNGNLDRARVQSVVPCVDTTNGTGYDVAVNMEWSGQGDIEAVKENIHDKSPVMIILSSFKGSIRGANAVGTMNLVGSADNFTPIGTLDNAHIQQTDFGVVTIIRK